MSDNINEQKELLKNKIKNKKIFYLAKTVFDNKYRKFGISYINDDYYINRVSSYIFNRPDYEIFEGGILCTEDEYEFIETLFSNYIKQNTKYGKRANNIRKNCELYEIKASNILEIFFMEYKDKLNLELLTPEEVNILNLNYEEYLKNTGIEYKEFNYSKRSIADFNKYIERKEKNNFKLRDYQVNTLQKWASDNYKSGILNYHPGLGKTITALFMLYELYKNNSHITLNIVWSTYYLDILYSQKSDFNLLKDMLNLNIIDCVSNNSKKIDCNQIKENKINIFLTNNNSLPSIENEYKKLKYTVFISDECKRITANVLYNFMKFCKSNNIKIIGLDGTPIKGNNKKSIERIMDIFTEDYIIDEITYIEALQRKLCVPLKIKWVYIPQSKEKKEKLTVQEYKDILQYNDLILEIYNGSKCISWASSIEESKNYYQALENVFKEQKLKYENYISNSQDDPNNLNMKKYLESNNNNVNINCVDRFKEGTNDKNIFHGVQISAIKKQETHVFIQQTARLTRLAEGKDIATYYILVDENTEEEKKENLINSLMIYYNNYFTDYKINIKRIKNKIVLSSKNKITNEEYICLEIEGLNELDFKEVYERIHKKANKKILDKEDFIKFLKENNFTYENYSEMRQKNYLILDERYDNYRKLYPNFCWSEVSDEYYNSNEVINMIENYISLNKNNNDFLLLDFNDKIIKISNDDIKMPLHYDLFYDKKTCKVIKKLLS